MSAEPSRRDVAEPAEWLRADSAASLTGRERIAAELLDGTLALVRRRGFADADSLAAAAADLADTSYDLRRLALDPDTAGGERERVRGLALSLADLEAYQFAPRRALLCRGQDPILREGHLWQVAGTRGLGKTWLLQTLALLAASGAEALGLHAPEPCRVLYVDGEMGCEEIQARFAKLRKVLKVDLAAPLTVLAADWQRDFLPRLDTAEGQEYVSPFVAEADLIILDNRSCLFDAEGENEPTGFQPAQDFLLSLRRRRKAVITGHHANRMGTARGHSKAEDLLNVSLLLSRPEGYVADQGARFVVTFDKARGIFGAAAAPFVAALTEDGWALESSEAVEADGVRGKLREYLAAAAQAGERPRSASAAIRGAGVKKATGLKAWAAMLQAGEITEHPEGGWSLV